MIIVFNNGFINELDDLLQEAYKEKDNSKILKYFTEGGADIINKYLSTARRNRPKRVNIRHFFNAYIFDSNNQDIKEEYNYYKGTAEKRFKGKGWQQEEIDKIYKVFDKDTAPILLDLEEFHNRLNISGQLLYSTNLKICLSVMVNKSVKDCSTHTKLDDVIYKAWKPNEIVKEAEMHGQKQLSERKIRDCLEKHTKENPVLFKKDDTGTAYRLDWNKLILYENQHIEIPKN